MGLSIKTKASQGKSAKVRATKTANKISTPMNLTRVKEFAQETGGVVLEKISQLDASLIKLSPQLQSKMDALLAKIEKTPAGLQDLQALATRVLKHAFEMSETLKKKVSKKN